MDQHEYSFSSQGQPKPSAPPPRPRMTAAQRRKRRRARMIRRIALLVVCAAAAVALAVVVGKAAVGAVQTALSHRVDTTPVEYDVSGYVFDPNDPLLVVVNANLPLAEGYTVETLVADDSTGKQLATEAATAYRNMAAAAKANDIELMLCSGYRDNAYQAELFSARKQKYLDQGYSDADADARAATIVARPGTSEHATGLAADIVTPDHQNLDTGFADTKAFRWLMRYAPEYGFVLRYPEDRQAATGIVYEPWHWRYVGVENAKTIAQSGLSLEEFVALHTL